ncbi:ATP/GTP-binding protein [Streptomyces sp. NPDC026206]|uniref:ATP/GTP-binding protein n=1 Tax=Streptomyces sp. NPDC026206 TaxID=3157089 RepID=UPI0033C2C6B6
MDTEGTYDARGTRAHPVPRPARPPLVPPAAPPPPAYAPAARPAVVEWLNAPRRPAGPGIFRHGHVPPPPLGPDRVPDRALLSGAVISLLSGMLLWTLLWNGYIPYWRVPMKLVTPAEWWHAGAMGGPATMDAVEATVVYRAVLAALLIYGFGRLGNWPEVLRRFVSDRPQPSRAVAAALLAGLTQLLTWKGTLPVVEPVLVLTPADWLQGGGDPYLAALVVYVLYALITVALLWPFARLGDWTGLVRPRRAEEPRPPAGPPAGPAASPADWPELRAAGQTEAADRLAADLSAGRMNDVDCVRIRHTWASAQAEPHRLASFRDTVLRHGGASWAHPSGDRDLPERTATHDLLAGQVRIGRSADHARNPYARRGCGVALEPALLGTSLLAVGPPGAGKTRRLIRPVVESLALQALAGQCGVIVVCAAGTPLGPDEAYDVVVKPGDSTSLHDLDLYGGSTDPDEAAAFLAEGLVGDLDTVDTRRAATALAQLLGPYHAAHGRFPAVPELYELLSGTPSVLAALRERLDEGGHHAMRRELEARLRQGGSASDPCPALADRVALLDRPAFADFFAIGTTTRPFSLRSVQHHPLRVRVDLPERGHAEASRLLARLILAQFTAMATARGDRSLFTCLVLDDATGTLTTETVRGIQRLRSANAGVVLGLRTVDDVSESLHIALLSAVGCHMAFSGVTTWDGRRFAEAWGTEWVETREVAQHAVFADQPLTRAVHALRKLVTGQAVTRDAVTVRKVERERWSASELAHQVPAGHAVLSLTTVRGEHVPPLLVDLRQGTGRGEVGPGTLPPWQN